MSLRQQKIYKGGFWKPLTTEGLVFRRGTYINIKYILIPELLKMLQKWVCLYKHRCGKKAKYIVKLFKKQFLNHICSMVRFFYTENYMLEETDKVILRHRGYHWKMDIQDYLLGYTFLITDFKNKDVILLGKGNFFFLTKLRYWDLTNISVFKIWYHYEKNNCNSIHLNSTLQGVLGFFFTDILL